MLDTRANILKAELELSEFKAKRAAGEDVDDPDKENENVDPGK